jgi:hypothetical protein
MKNQQNDCTMPLKTYQNVSKHIMQTRIDISNPIIDMIRKKNITPPEMVFAIAWDFRVPSLTHRHVWELVKTNLPARETLNNMCGHDFHKI